MNFLQKLSETTTSFLKQRKKTVITNDILTTSKFYRQINKFFISMKTCTFYLF